jgi:hypothetical protein
MPAKHKKGGSAQATTNTTPRANAFSSAHIRLGVYISKTSTSQHTTSTTQQAKTRTFQLVVARSRARGGTVKVGSSQQG